jgi:magnesium transporter
LISFSTTSGTVATRFFARQRFPGNSNCQRHDSPIHLSFDFGADMPSAAAVHAPACLAAEGTCRRYDTPFPRNRAARHAEWTNSKPNRARARAAKRLSNAAKVGMAPGALVHLGERKTEQAAISLIEYGPGEIIEHQFESSLAESQAYQPRLPVLWLNVHGLHEPEVMAEIGRRFKLHPLVLEDILNTDQRPKVDDYGDYLFLVARFFEIDGETGQIGSDQVSLILGPNFVLSFQERPSGRFDPLRERLRQDRGQIRKLGADYLAYSLLDTVVDRYFTILEQIGERTEELEDMMLERPRPGALQTVHQLKRETLTLRRSIWPLREVINNLTRADERFFRPETRPTCATCTTTRCMRSNRWKPTAT